MALSIRSQLVYVALLCTAICFTSSYQDKILLVAKPETRQRLLQQAEICSKETGVPAAALKNMLHWPLPDTRASKQFFQCVCYNTEYTDKDGHFIVDTFWSFKVMNGTKEEVADAIRECNKVTLADPSDTAYAMGDCIHKYCLFAVEK